MLRSDELKKEISAKRTEVENLQREKKIAEAKNAAKELAKMVDEYDVALAMEKSDFEKFFASLKNQVTGNSSGIYEGGVSGDEYRKNFLSAIRAKFKNGTANSLRESSLPDGGYLVPSEFHKEIVTALEDENILRKIGMTIQTASSHRIPIVATKPEAMWVGEGETIDFTNESFGQVNLEAYKLATSIKVSNELLADSVYPLEDHITREFAKAFGRTEENYFLNGTSAEAGRTQKSPVGLLTTLEKSPSTTITTASASLTPDDLLNLEFSLRRPYRSRACWLLSDALLSQVRKMKDADGNFIWQPSLTEAEPQRLFGYPVYTSAYMPEMTSGNVIALFGDFADFYVIGERGERIFKALNEIFAMSDQTGFLMLERIDAVLTNLEAIKALKLK